MPTFQHNGLTFTYGPHAVGDTANGRSTAAGAARRIIQRDLKSLRVLDVCCGIGMVGMLLKQAVWDRIQSLTLSDINVFNLDAVRRNLKANGMEGEVLLSDGIRHIPARQQFDLIVSNPPHFPQDSWQYDVLTPSILGGHDDEWRFHRHFYANCRGVLSERGEVWFLENGNASSVDTFKSMIESGLEYVGSEQEPSDPAYYWFMARQRT